MALLATMTVTFIDGVADVGCLCDRCGAWRAGRQGLEELREQSWGAASSSRMSPQALATNMWTQWPMQTPLLPSVALLKALGPRSAIIKGPLWPCKPMNKRSRKQDAVEASHQHVF